MLILNSCPILISSRTVTRMGIVPFDGAELQRGQVGSRHAYYCPNRQGEKGS